MFACLNSAALLRSRRARLLAGCAAAAVVSSPAFAQQAFQATPTIVSGDALIDQGNPIPGGLRDRVFANSSQVVINWTPNDEGTGGGPITILPAGNELRFQNNGDIGVGKYTVLNRVIPEDPSRAIQFDGHVVSQFDSGYGAVTGGSIWFYSPGGIIAGPTARFDVGNLVLSANDIDFAGGLFADGNSNALAGTIRFRGDTDSRSAVTIMPGAQVNVAGNYLAIVAPRVTQAGALNVEGGAALVAAESADITIPVSGGLFDISVQTGSRVDAGGETTLVHSGTTEVRDAGVTGAQRRVYLVAVPKNDAVTMLVAGSLGYAPAAQAQLAANGVIYLTTGSGVLGDNIVEGTQGDIHITGGNFGGRTIASAQNIAVDTSTSSLSFATDLFALANSGAITLSASGGRNFKANGDVLLRHENADPTGASTIAVSATDGSRIEVNNNLTLASFARGASQDEDIAATSAKGGTVSLTATSGGLIAAVGSIAIDSSAAGGQGNDLRSGDGTGGTITVSANGGQISVGNVLDLNAEGFGGDSGYGGIAGDGFGGAITVAETDAGVNATGVQLFANGNGGFQNPGGTAGSGTGGSATLSLLRSGLGAGSIRIGANGLGRDGDTNAGGGSGGTVTVFNKSSSGIGVSGIFSLDATGQAGTAFGGAGVKEGTGGSIQFVNDAATLTIGEGILLASADGIGGFSRVYGPTTGRGGSIAMTLNAADPTNSESEVTVSGIALSADGRIGQPSELRFSVPHGNSGTGVGGSVVLNLAGGPIFTGNLTLSASGTGANSDYDKQAGAGFAGRAELAINGADVTANTVSIFAQAIGGDGAFGETGYGGAGSGGAAGLGINPFGAGSGAYVTGASGTLSANALVVSADSSGGIGGDVQSFTTFQQFNSGAGGAAVGGTAQIATSGVAFDIGSAGLSAQGSGGAAGEVLYPTFFAGEGTIETANGGTGGAGTGGAARVQIAGGTQRFGSLEATADGVGGAGGGVQTDDEEIQQLSAGATSVGGSGGDALGGEATILFTQATVADEPEIFTRAFGQGANGGRGAQGGNGGNGQGGTALVRFDGGSASLYRAGAFAGGFGGSGADADRLDGGNGGDGRGGSAAFEAVNGAVVDLLDDGQGSPFSFDARAFGGSGGFGGSSASSGVGGKGGFGGSAFGGSASILVASQAAIDIPGTGDGESPPPSLIVSTSAGNGGDGGFGDFGGVGGDGGAAFAGTATATFSGGKALFENLFADATAQRGFGGSGAQDAPSGALGIGVGGRFVLKVDDIGGTGQFLADDLAADLGGSDVDGSLLIADTGAAATGGITVGTLYVVSGNSSPNQTESSSDFDIQSSARRITVLDRADLTANGNVRFAFQGTGGLDAGDTLNARSLTRGITVTHANPLAASISAPTLRLQANQGDIDAQQGSLLTSTDSIDIQAFGTARIAEARATDRIDINAFGDAVVGSLAAGDSETIGNIAVRAGASEGFVPANLAVTGVVTSTGGITLQAGRDASIEAGAKVVADSFLTVASGDDIIVGQGALLRAANNPPAETGYGVSDPLQQYSQLRLLAGDIETSENVEGNVASILIGGTLEAPNRTLFMSGGAVQAGTATQLTAGNLYVRLDNIPSGDQVPSSDGGQLSGICLEGSVCLGTTRVSNIVRIGEVGFEPINLRLNGGIDGTDILLRGRSVTLGQTGISNSIEASDSLTIESLNATLTLNGPLAIEGGTSLARVASLRSITGSAAKISAPGTLELYAGNNIALGGIAAGSVRTIDFKGAVVNASGITAPGSLSVDTIAVASDLDLKAGTTLSIDSVTLPDNKALTASAASIANINKARAGSIALSGQRAVLRDAVASGAVQVTGSTGGVSLGTVRAGDLRVVSGSNTDFSDLGAATSIQIDSTLGVNGGTAAADFIRVTTQSALVADRLAGGLGGVTVNADSGLFLNSVASNATSRLNAKSGSIQIKNDATGLIEAAGTDIAITGQNGLQVQTATASAGNISLATVSGLLRADSTSATGNIALNSGGGITFNSATAGGALTLSALSDISGSMAVGKTIALTAAGAIKIGNIQSTDGISATGASVDLASQTNLRIVQAVARSGDVSLVAANGIKADTVSATGTATLKSGAGPLVVTNDLVAGNGLILGAPSIDITAQNGLNVLQADATAGDLSLKAISGTLNAGKSTATGAITLASGADVTATSLKTGSGAITVSGTKGVTVQTIASAGPVTLAASGGTVKVSTDLVASGPVQATGQAIDLTALGDLALAQASASAGDIALKSINGSIALGQVNASKALTATTTGLLTVNGAVTGATMALTSKDITIASGAQLGSKTQTTALTLTSTADRLFVGDGPTGAGYRLDASEVARIASAGDITIASAPTNNVATAFTFADPVGSNAVLGTLVFDGSQLGATGTLLVTSPRAVGVTGNMQFKNIQSGQTVTLRSASDLSLAAETGLVTLKDGNGGLSGTLRLEAQQVHAMSTKARSEIAGLDLNSAKQRLGTNDQLENNDGYFQAGRIIVRISRLAFIQNSGANSDDPNAKRGFTANNFSVESTGTQPVQLILNGRVGAAIGANVIGAVSLGGLVDPLSSFNGCIAGMTCGVLPTPEPIFNFRPALNFARDQIEDVQDQDESEEALQASQSRPQPIIQLVAAPTSRFDPLIDQPVTGAGNEDLWEATAPPTP